jgi:iron complex outermembrane recepter protein
VPPLRPRLAVRLLTLLAAVLAPAVSRAAETAPWLDFAELARIKVVTPSKRPLAAWETPAAVTVITAPEIRAAGALRIPEALRLAPGVEVAQINAQRHAVTVRGFASEFSNKLLVLQDGRSLFNPQILGVFWDVQDFLLDDLERIEVVRGPGGTAWGANAMNGVINVLTKDARDTQGSLLHAVASTLEPFAFHARHGGVLGNRTHYRAFVKRLDYGATERANGASAGEAGHQLRAGFRVDGDFAEDRGWILQGEMIDARLLQYRSQRPDLFDANGANLVGRVFTTLADGSELRALAYLDRTRRYSTPATAHSDTANLDLTYVTETSPRHTVSLDAGYRYVRNQARGNAGHLYSPAVRALRFGSLAASNDFEFVERRLKAGADLKAEYNDFTGWETLPGAHLTWTPAASRMLWARVSRALQTPSIAAYDLTIDFPGAVRTVSLPNRDRPLGTLRAAEIGGRFEPNSHVRFDVALFLADYTKLESVRTVITSTSGIALIPANDFEARSTGAEIAVEWQSGERWRFNAGYNLLELDLSVVPHTPLLTPVPANFDPRIDTALALSLGVTDPASATFAEDRSPRQQAQVMASFRPSERWDLTLWVRHVGRRPSLRLPAYETLDLRVEYHPTESLSLVVGGRNLLDRRTQEHPAPPGFPAASQIPRALSFELVWSR